MGHDFYSHVDVAAVCVVQAPTDAISLPQRLKNLYLYKYSSYASRTPYYIAHIQQQIAQV